MAYDGWVEFGGVELINLSRTAQLAETLAVDSVWIEPERVQWIEDALGGSGYADITNAPWYDPDHPASAEFAGFVPMSIPALDNSTAEAEVTEYITEGGNVGRIRNATLPIVANVAIVAQTDRGAEYGKRWLDRMIRGNPDTTFCAGTDLRYFRFSSAIGGPTPSVAHRRDVSLTRGTSVTRKRPSVCGSTWFVTFTWTAADSYEYGEEQTQFTDLGGSVTGLVVDSGSMAMTEASCPQYDYTPIYDPLYPALSAPPPAPTFYPSGWDLEDGYTFNRSWVRTVPVEPSALNAVPVVLLTADLPARMVRLSVWPADEPTNSRCGPLWTAIITYLPPNVDFYIDGEQKAVYVWDGLGEAVRRADTLVYGTDATPLQWAAFNDSGGLLVTLDVFTDSGDADPVVRADLSLVPKSD